MSEVSRDISGFSPGWEDELRRVVELVSHGPNILERLGHLDACVDSVKEQIKESEERVNARLDGMTSWMRWGVGIAATVGMGVIGLLIQYQQLLAARAHP